MMSDAGIPDYDPSTDDFDVQSFGEDVESFGEEVGSVGEDEEQRGGSLPVDPTAVVTERDEEPIPEGKSVLNVNILTTSDEILRADANGVVLRFDPNIGQFAGLEEDFVRTLSTDNRLRYSQARNMHERLRREAEGQRRASTPGIEVTYNPTLGQGSASRKIEVDGQDGAYHYYWAGAWEYQDRLAEGYEVVGKDEVRTSSQTPTNSHQLMRNGQPEHILLKIPKERFDRHLRAVSEKSQAMIKGAVSSARDRIDRAGGQSFEGEAPAGSSARWSDSHGG